MASTVMMPSASLSLSARRNVGGGVASRKLAQRSRTMGSVTTDNAARRGRAIGVTTRATAPQGDCTPRGTATRLMPVIVDALFPSALSLSLRASNVRARGVLIRCLSVHTHKHTASRTHVAETMLFSFPLLSYKPTAQEACGPPINTRTICPCLTTCCTRWGPTLPPARRIRPPARRRVLLTANTSLKRPLRTFRRSCSTAESCTLACRCVLLLSRCCFKGGG